MFLLPVVNEVMYERCHNGNGAAGAIAVQRDCQQKMSTSG